MSAAPFTPSKVTVNMDPVDVSAGSSEDAEPKSGQREILWMVRTPDAEVGPVSAALIERGLNLGRVPDTAEVAPQGSDAWRPVAELFSDEEEKETPESEAVTVVAVKVVEVGQSDFEWPDTFAPKRAAEPMAAIKPPPPHIETRLMAPAVSLPAAVAASVPASVAPPAPTPSASHNEPLTIPTTGPSPAVMAFAATLGVSAVLAGVIALISAL